MTGLNGIIGPLHSSYAFEWRAVAGDNRAGLHESRGFSSNLCIFAAANVV